MSKLWEIAGKSSDTKDNPELILTQYAKQMKADTENLFTGIVTDSINEETGAVSYSLYISVPALRGYMYRLIEVIIQNLVTPYPVEIRFFAKDPVNNRVFQADKTSYKKRLEELIKSPVTKNILLHLKTLVDIKEEYQQD